MGALDELGQAAIAERRALIERAAMLILDCNRSAATLAAALRLANGVDVPVVVDPVSVAKAERRRAALVGGARVHTVTPNLDELSVLTSRCSPAMSSRSYAATTRSTLRSWDTSPPH